MDPYHDASRSVLNENEDIASDSWFETEAMGKLLK